MNIIAKGLRKSGNYLFQDTDFIDKESFVAMDNVSPIYIPLVMDTEYYNAHYTDILSQGIINSRLPVTCQLKTIHQNDAGKIFVYPDFELWNKENGMSVRHPVLKNGLVFVDYLQAMGYDCELKRNPDYEELKELPLCEFIYFAHFAIAELYLITLYDLNDMEADINNFRNDLNNYVLKKRIQFGKRTFCQHKMNTVSKDSIYTHWQIRIENKTYRIKLAIFDTAALHGSKSYKVLAANTGVKLDSKDLMKSWIEKMHVAYNEVPGDYDNYALGDLKVYDILKANAMNFEQVYDSLGIADYYMLPKLSIGATVANVFRAKIGQLFNISDKKVNEIIDLYCRKGTAQYLLTKRSLTSCYLAKVDGGRCRNNRPLDIQVQGALCDLDISGCYGEGQRGQMYPFGNPLILEFPIESHINRFPSLREFLESVKYGQDDNELVYGLWFARICTKSPLVFEQDFVSSWFDPSFHAMENDESSNIDASEHIADVLDTKTGKNKILLNEIQHGVIQSDFLDWLFEVCGKHQRTELLDCLYVESAVIYPASERCNSIPELYERTESEKGQNTCILQYRTGNNKTCKIMTECESYAWYGVNLGEFLIDDLMARRKTYPKKNSDGSTNSFNELYKLLVNTLYGDMASPYFDIGNTTVGNNITARARALAYYIEKGLYAFQIITDGGTFDLNKVAYPLASRKWKITAIDYCGMYHKNVNCRLAPLGGYDKIDLIYPANLYPVLCLYKDNVVKCLQGKKAQQWIDKATFEHLQNLFPNVTVLHGQSSTMVIRDNDHNKRDYIPRIGMYEFEMKDFYTKGVFHSSSNYWLISSKSDALKMRSYEKKKHDTVRLNDNYDFEMLETYNKETPAQYFMRQLTHPENVERGYVFTKDTILKIGEYVQRQNSLYQDSILVPGDTYWKQGLLREFSLSQFTFRTIKQYKEWEKLISKMKEQHGQSLEMFFINKDETLNLQTMVQWFDKTIDDNISAVKALRALSKERKMHPRFLDLLNVKRELAKRCRTYDYLYSSDDDD